MESQTCTSFDLPLAIAFTRDVSSLLDYVYSSQDHTRGNSMEPNEALRNKVNLGPIVNRSRESDEYMNEETLRQAFGS